MSSEPKQSARKCCQEMEEVFLDSRKSDLMKLAYNVNNCFHQRKLAQYNQETCQWVQEMCLVVL